MDSITTPASKITDLQNQINTLKSALDRKSNLYDEGFSLYFRTVATDFNDRIEALKNSIQHQTMEWDEGVTICYVISSNTDDRGVAIVVKKVNKNRCAFHYFDYWGVNEFWTLTDAGWEQKG